MPKHSLLHTLNSISDFLTFDLAYKGEPLPPIIYGANSEHPLRLLHEDREGFRTNLNDLLEHFPKIKETLSVESLIDRLIPIISERKLAGEHFTQHDAKTFEESIKNLPIRKFKVVKRLLGATLSAERDDAKIGDFEISYGKRIFANCEKTASRDCALKPEDDAQMFIQIDVQARDYQAAYRVADAHFYQFELLFRVLVGTRTPWIEVGIINHTGAKMRDRFLLSEEGQLMTFGSSLQGALQPFILYDERFPAPTGPMLRLFELITRSQNEFERHIVRAAEWVGQAIAELNEASALVKAAIALEVLFSTNEKGIINASIMAQIAESCALLLGSSTNSPVEIEKTVKHLYGERSAVVHSGRNTVKSKDLNTFISICRQLILLLLSKPEYLSMKSMEELKGYLKNKKYSSCS